MKLKHSPEFRHLSDALQAAVEEAVGLIYAGAPTVTLATIESDKGAEAVAYLSLDGLLVHWYILEPKVTMSGTSSALQLS